MVVNDDQYLRKKNIVEEKDEEVEKSKTIFVKNLNFESNEEAFS